MHGITYCTTQKEHVSSRCMLKLDLKGAYDSFEWLFSDEVQPKMIIPQEVCKTTNKWHYHHAS